MQYTYRVQFETDPESREVVVSLPTLNYTGDFADTVEEAVRRLQELASGFLEVLAESGEDIPPSDPLGEGLYLSFEVREEMAVPA